MNLATAEEFHAEIARLQAEIDRLRSRPCPYVTGNVTNYCTLTPFTLTDAEREAVEEAADTSDVAAEFYSGKDHTRADAAAKHAATLRGLLERTK